MNTNKAIILAAGMSSRMKKVQTDLNISERLMKEALNKPKSMIGLGPNEEPFLIYLIWEYYKAGIRELCLVLNERDQFTEDYFSTERAGFLSEIKLFFAYQRIPEGRSKPMGTAEALEVGLKAVPHLAVGPLDLLALLSQPVILLSEQPQALPLPPASFLELLQPPCVFFFPRGVPCQQHLLSLTRTALARDRLLLVVARRSKGVIDGLPKLAVFLRS